MCSSVQLDVSVTGALCRAKPLPNAAIDFFSPLLGQHPLPRWGTLAAWAVSPVPPVPQSGIILAAGRSALPGLSGMASMDGTGAPGSARLGGGTIREAGKEPGSPRGLGLIYQYGLLLVHTSSTPQDTLTAFSFLFSLAAALFSHTQQDSLLHSDVYPERPSQTTPAPPSFSLHPALYSFFIALIPI